jgi:Single-strand binding protein family
VAPHQAERRRHRRLSRPRPGGEALAATSSLGRAASSSRGGTLVLPPPPGWRDLAGRCWHARPQPQVPHQPTRLLSRPQPAVDRDRPTSLALSLAPGGLSACHGVHRPPGPRAGQTARPGIQEGPSMTEASVSFAGNLTDQPEVRYTESGIARAMFRVAVSGRRGQEPSFFTVIAWRDQAEHVAESLSKGAGSWSWVGSSSGPGPPRMATADPWSRSWPRSWGQACAGRRRPRPGRHAVKASSRPYARAARPGRRTTRRPGWIALSYCDESPGKDTQDHVDR